MLTELKQYAGVHIFLNNSFFSSDKPIKDNYASKKLISYMNIFSGLITY